MSREMIQVLYAEGPYGFRLSEEAAEEYEKRGGTQMREILDGKCRDDVLLNAIFQEFGSEKFGGQNTEITSKQIDAKYKEHFRIELPFIQESSEECVVVDETMYENEQLRSRNEQLRSRNEQLRSRNEQLERELEELLSKVTQMQYELDKLREGSA